ncbi:hypothetical protein BC332_00881 [Capsicum chinense]|nr:hypothetical protein BC332_00881 [Capsicum chinense]
MAIVLTGGFGGVWALESEADPHGASKVHVHPAMGHEIIYRMAQLILRDSRATSEMYEFASEVARISSKSMNFAYLGTRLSIAPNYAPPTQSAESSPMQVCRQGRHSASRYSTHQGRRGGRRADNFGLSLATRCAI